MNWMKLNQAKFLQQINFPDEVVGILQLQFSSTGPLIACLEVFSNNSQKNTASRKKKTKNWNSSHLHGTLHGPSRLARRLARIHISIWPAVFTFEKMSSYNCHGANHKNFRFKRCAGVYMSGYPRGSLNYSRISTEKKTHPILVKTFKQFQL